MSFCNGRALLRRVAVIRANLYYWQLMYNPSDEPVKIQNSVISALIWNNIFIDEINVQSLSLFDCRALFGPNMHGRVANDGAMGIMWQKNNCSVGINFTLSAGPIVVQLNDGPDIFTAIFEQCM